MTITVNTPVTPSFTQVVPVCAGDVFTLPSTSNNGVVGVWSPAENNTATTTYTFTPNAGQCAVSTTMTVVVNSFIEPIFTPISDLCVGATPIVLPLISNNGISGTWSPSQVDTSQSNISVYTFTPSTTISQCASPITISVHVIQCTIQKGISPNGDMKNDYLKLRAEKVEIFNRYGKEVYSKVNYDNDWYGQSNNGSSLPDGTYYYVIQLLGGETKSGWIYINKQD